MTNKVDINVDIGEGFAFDSALMDYATSANVCCGAHAGSWELTKETITLCQIKGVRIGMHPGFPDRDTMGRIRMREDEVKQYANSIFEQAIQFLTYCADVEYLKPHGGWYNMLVELSHPESHLHRAARLILDGVISISPVPTMLLQGCPLGEDLKKEGLRVIGEGFADRRYENDGTLTARSKPGAILTDPDNIKAQVLGLAPTVESICIHGDTPNCVDIARFVYQTLEESGFEVGY